MTDEIKQLSARPGADSKYDFEQKLNEARALERSATDSMESSDRPAVWASVIPRRIGNYEVEGEIGRGGMGIVYRGHDTRLDRPVAIKVLPDVFATEARRRARFEREAKLLALVNHSNIAAIYAIEEVDERSYLILEYVAGQTLGERLEDGPLPLAEALRLARQTAQAIQAAHERGVIHRDLKPANIRVTPEGLVKVLDFGLAKLESAPQEGAEVEITREGALLGTTAYMSPEQLMAHQGDQRVDVWAFGCVLFECLTGGRIWGQGTTPERVRAIHAAEPEWSELPPETPERVRGLLRGCLEKDRTRRLHDMSEVVRELEAALGEQAGAKRGPGQDCSLLLVVAPERAGNLTGHFTSFLGREPELEDLRQLLALARLVTLTGAGGTGKTRLAVELGRSVRSSFRDGVWLADLAPLTDAGLVPHAVASIFHVKEIQGKSLTESLASQLAELNLLLVLDNCEHVLPACVRLVKELLPRCPGVTLLATSREPLGVAGEQVFQVRPLGAPSRGASLSLEELERYESVRLFVERARAVAPDFRLTEENAEALVQVCARLDGLPLAVELAAARVRALSVEQIAARLDDRFRLLKSPDRTAPRRHQTLRALVDWSYDALDEPEKALMRRLSVFAGGFALEAAEAICSSEEVAEEDVLDLLTVLLDRSLVTVERRGRVVRYRLLETVRDYGHQRLLEVAEAGRMAEAFLDYYLELASEAAVALRGRDQAVWLDRIAEELDNLRKVLRSSFTSAERVQKGLTIGTALNQFWRGRGLATEGRELLEALLASEHAVANETRVRALNVVGLQAYAQGDLDLSRQYHEEALALARELGSESCIASSLLGVGSVLACLGDHAGTLSRLEEARELYRSLGSREGVLDALTNLAVAYHLAGDKAAAREALEECLSVRRELGDEWSLALTLSNLAVREMQDGHPERARTLLEESLAVREKLADRRGLIRTRLNLSMLDMARGDLDGARRLLLELLPIAEEIGDKEARGTIANNLAALEYKTGHPAEARPWAVQGLPIALQSGHSLLILNLLENCARIELGRGHTERAALITGATEELRALQESPRDPMDIEEHEQTLAQLEERLGREALSELLERGGLMDVEQAVDLVLEEPEDCS